jgi:UDP-glucose/iron transport system ATP-binding protein
VITDYRQRQQAAVVWVSHDPAQIARVADRHLRVTGGRLLEPDAESGA